MLFTADAHRDDGKRYVARADEKLTAFVNGNRRFVTLKRQRIAKTPVNSERLGCDPLRVSEPLRVMLRGGGTPLPTAELPGVSSSALSVSSAVVSERFFNFLSNFAPAVSEEGR